MRSRFRIERRRTLAGGAGFALVAVAGARVPVAQALDRVSFQTNWLAQAEQGGYYQAVAAGIGYLVLYPGFGANKGVLGWTSQGELARDVASNNASKIADSSTPPPLTSAPIIILPARVVPRKLRNRRPHTKAGKPIISALAPRAVKPPN